MKDLFHKTMFCRLFFSTRRSKCLSSFPVTVNLGIWDKLTRVVIFLLFLAGLLGVFFWYLPLIEQNQRYRKHILSLDMQIQEQERIARQLKQAIDAVQNDPRTLERLARERLGYARTNEVVIRFETRR
jgi:cell division protein FtsB